MSHREQFQKTLNKVMETEAELRNIEDQIERLEEIYLHHTWDDGNIVIGWTHHSKPIGPKPNTKDRIFSLSSATSTATHNLQQGISKQLSSEVEDCIVSNRRLRKTRRGTEITPCAGGESNDSQAVLVITNY